MSKSNSYFSHGMAKWALFVLLLFVLWFGGWFVAASLADRQLVNQLDQLAGKGLSIRCENRDITGFPFRLGLQCNSTAVSANAQGVELESGALRTAAQIYAPTKIIAELDSPLVARNDGRTLEASWTKLRAFVKARLDPGFDQISINHAGLVVDTAGFNLTTKEGDIHLRPTPEGGSEDGQNSLDFAARSSGVTGVLSSNIRLPESQVLIDATLLGGYNDLVLGRQTLRDILSDGAEIEIRNLGVQTPDGGQLIVAGPVSLDEQGLISGVVTIGVQDPRSLTKWAGQINPQVSAVISNLGQAINGLGQQSQIAGQRLRTISVKIDKGRVVLGFIDLGRIPPLQFQR